MQTSDLETGLLHRFSNFAAAAVPANIAGVYTIWDGERFIYVGIGGTQVRHVEPSDEAEPSKPVKGLRGRCSSTAQVAAAGTSSASTCATASSCRR